MASKNPNLVLKKQKDEGASSKNGQGTRRPALGDIGNLVPVDGKPITRPITRRYAKLLADAQAAAAVTGTKNTKKAEKQKAPQKENVNKAVLKRVSTQPASQKPAIDKLPLPKSRSSRRRSLHTLTYVLSYRSKDACGKNEETVENIDEGERGDQFDVVEYVQDIYIYYKEVEDTYWPSDYMSFQTGINPKMREILIGWIIEVHQAFELRPETLYLSVYIFDRYLSLEPKPVRKREIQLIGLCSILLASKYEEIWSPGVTDLINAAKNVYTRADVLDKEKQMIYKLGWYLTVPTPYMFLVRFIKTANDDNELENMIYFFAELALMNYSLINYVPSLVAASCVYAARGTLGKIPIWNRLLTRYTSYTEPQLWQCARLLLISHFDASGGKFNEVYKKYSKISSQKVALRRPVTIAECLSSNTTGIITGTSSCRF